MSREVLIATKRDASGKSPVARRLRKTGVVPGVLYRGGDSLPFQANVLEVSAVLRHGATLVDLDVDGTKHASVIKDYQVHPLKGTLQHIDLQEVRMDQMIKTTVSVILVGESAGVKAGGVLNQLAHELNIESTPLNIPDNIEIDITDVELGGSLHLSDVPAPEGVEFLDAGDTSIMTITVPRSVAAEEADLGDASTEEAAEGGEAAAGEAPAAGGDESGGGAGE
jgi:large subunit ribosomal protein L25